MNYSVDEDIKIFREQKQIQSKLKTTSLDYNSAYEGPIPIFIVGMPRSGTTLVEQIISSHSKVTGAGELPYISRYGSKFITNKITPNRKNILEFRKQYMEHARSVNANTTFITDKMPQNFLFVSLISTAFPEAKIVHVKRDPRATCWSNYRQYFSANGLGYSYDIQDVVTYYNLYIDLMSFWQSEYHNRIYNLDYDLLTMDQENQTRKLIKYLDLGWEKVCLFPQKNKRSVYTASQEQVRKKVYTGSSREWLKYEQYLKDAFDNLKNF